MHNTYCTITIIRIEQCVPGVVPVCNLSGWEAVRVGACWICGGGSLWGF